MKKQEAFTPTGAENVTWNLDDLVPPPADEGILSILAKADAEVDAFAAKYRGRVAGLSAQQMKVLLTEYEPLIEAVGRAESYAYLSWATQSDEPARGALLQKVAERQSQLSQKAVFLDIEWANAPDETARKLIDDPLLSRWRHWLIISRRYKPHLLSEPEEKILAEKSVTGRQAWVRYFDETMAAAHYEWEGGQVPLGVVLPDLYMRMLASGGSDWPTELVKPLGVYLTDAGFWKQGLSLLEKMVGQAEGLAKTVNA